MKITNEITYYANASLGVFRITHEAHDESFYHSLLFAKQQE